MGTIVQVENLRKTYGATVAVEELSFEVSEGEIFGMVGPNGAGKTTTIECLEGLRKPDRGNVRVLGLDPQRDSQALRKRTGMQLQQSNLPERMKVWEALDLYSSFYSRTADWKELLAQLGLEEKRNTPFSKLSGGQKQRLFIALALLPDPQLVFLDELTTGLDPQARHAIWDLVQDVRAQGQDRFVDHAFHGRGRAPVRPGGHPRPWAYRGAGYSGGPDPQSRGGRTRRFQRGGSFTGGF